MPAAPGRAQVADLRTRLSQVSPPAPLEAKAAHHSKPMILKREPELLEIADRPRMRPTSEVVAEKREEIAGLVFEDLDIASLHLLPPAGGACVYER